MGVRRTVVSDLMALGKIAAHRLAKSRDPVVADEKRRVGAALLQSVKKALRISAGGAVVEGQCNKFLLLCGPAGQAEESSHQNTAKQFPHIHPSLS